VKTTEVGGEDRGYDGGKKIKDASGICWSIPGLLLAVVIRVPMLTTEPPLRHCSRNSGARLSTLGDDFGDTSITIMRSTLGWQTIGQAGDSK